MADQASVNGGKRVPVNSPLTAGVFGNLADLANDVASLVELQAKLAVVDLKATVVKATIPLGLVAGGAAVLVAALPVLMIGLAELLADGLGLAHRGWAYLIVAAGGAVLAGSWSSSACPDSSRASTVSRGLATSSTATWRGSRR